MKKLLILTLVMLSLTSCVIGGINSLSTEKRAEYETQWTPDVVYLKNGTQKKGNVNILEKRISIYKHRFIKDTKPEKIKDIAQIDSVISYVYDGDKKTKKIWITDTIFHKPLAVRNTTKLLRRVYKGEKYEFYEAFRESQKLDKKGGMELVTVLDQVIITAPQSSKVLMAIKGKGGDKSILSRAKKAFSNTAAIDQALANKKYKKDNFNLYSVLDNSQIAQRD